MDVVKRDECGTVTDDALHHGWVVVVCISLVRFVIKVRLLHFIFGMNFPIYFVSLRLITYQKVYELKHGFTIVDVMAQVNWITIDLTQLIIGDNASQSMHSSQRTRTRTL